MVLALLADAWRWHEDAAEGTEARFLRGDQVDACVAKAENMYGNGTQKSVGRFSMPVATVVPNFEGDCCTLTVYGCH